MQTIICKVQNCGYCSTNGFCLNRLTVINGNGVCDYVTKPGWDQQVEQWKKNTYRQPEPAAVAQELLQTSERKD